MFEADCLFGQTAVVSGCAGGLGASIAATLARYGAAIVALEMDNRRCEAAASTLTEQGVSNLATVVCDVASPGSVSSAFAEIDRMTGRLDILVNSAGIREIRSAVDIDPEEWMRVVAVNLHGPFLCSREAARRMIPQKSGTIINISSVAARFGMPSRPAYNASKHGVVGLTRNMAKDLGPHGIRVNTVAPGLIRTALTERYFSDEAFVEGLRHVVPLDVEGQPQDVADAVLFLASPFSRFINGIVLPVDGGWSAEKGYVHGDGGSVYTSPGQ